MNDAELHERASELFLELRRLPPHEREAALAEATDDARLRAEVRELLLHDEPEPTQPIAGEPPEHIGPYRIVRRLGRGGSGQVFLAEQREPIRRRVALKIVAQAAVDPELAARFEVERRALERTDHPNIARVLDAGRTADGLPYLVMDYVEGVALHRHCDERGLDLRARLELVLQIADAIEHAHQRGVIHRDLKPANILVAEVDGRATPRVLDFGIAKPVAGAFADKSPRTSGLPVGTPSYMAPEQTGTGAVDTRADVYALGAVTYELVAGRPPLDARGDPLAALQRIRDVVPVAASRARGESQLAEPVSSAVLGDLDLILAKALEKQPERRYPSVGAFAADLRRLLRFEPIEARRPTLGYRAARFARRNRLLVAASALVAAGLALGVIGLTAGLLEARRQQREAANQSEAQREINQFLTDDLLAGAAPDNRGPDVTARELLDRASERIDERFSTRPLTAAALHHTLGGAYAELGLFDEAQSHLSRAFELRRANAGENAPDTLRSEIALSSLRSRLHPDEAAEKSLRALAERARRYLGVDEPLLYSVLNDLGFVLMSQGRDREAVPVLEEALANRTRLLGAQHREVLITTGNLANAYGALGDTRASLKLLESALAIAEALPGQQRATLLGLDNNIGATYQDLGENEKAAPYLRRAAELAEQMLGADHPDTLTIQANLAGLEADVGDPAHAAELYQHVATKLAERVGPDAEETFVARYGYWNALWKAHRNTEAAVGFAELADDLANALGDAHWLTGQTQVSWARALLDADRAQEALPHAELGAARLTELLGPDHDRTRGAAAILAQVRERLGAATARD